MREQVQKRVIELLKDQGEENPTDAFTKSLDKKRLKRLLQLVGVTDAK